MALGRATIGEVATRVVSAPHVAAKVGYMPGLDGMRALAVLAVIAYHAGIGLNGGFLGVETFFVISGFLITSLLLAEWETSGNIDLRGFWIRRARRLLPALFLVLLVVLIFAAIALRDEFTAIGADALASLVYITNWHLLAVGSPYFDPLARPSPLQHLWSLAVEEQFYVIWPVLFMLGIRYIGRRGLLAATVIGAIASLLLGISLYQPDSDPSRIYYGTDTRASGLLLGAALGLIWRPQPQLHTRAVHGRAADVGGLLALAALVLLIVTIDAQTPWLYQGGFVLVALLTCTVIVAATHSGARLMPALLSGQVMRWIGVRSYGLYLWHWPIIIVTRPGIDTALDGLPLLALRVSLIVLLAELSYRYIEQPLRTGSLTQWPQRIIHALQTRAPSGMPARGMFVALTLVLVTAACSSSLPVTGGTGQLPGATSGEVAVAVTVTIDPAAFSTVAPGTTMLPAASTTPLTTVTAVPSSTTVASVTPSTVPTVAATTVPTLPPIDATTAAAVQRVLDNTVADGSIPGVSVTVRIPGRAPWQGVAGVAARGAGGPAMTPDTRMRIASISKIFTAVVIMQLVDEGKVRLDQPLSDWFPEIVPGAERMTVRALLQHTTGLYDYLEDQRMQSKAYSDPARRWQPAELVKYAGQQKTLFAPQAAGRWDYSSTNYVILGIIVEEVTGNSLATEMRSRIFTPLALESTFFADDEPIVGPAARGYGRGRDQTAVSMSFAFATANIVSTTADVARFGEALMAGDLMSPTAMDMMQEFTSGKGQYNMPELEYGLGLMRSRLLVRDLADREQSRVVGHIGGFGGFRSALWHAPASGITVALGVNQGGTDPNLLATRVYSVLLVGR